MSQPCRCFALAARAPPVAAVRCAVPYRRGAQGGAVGGAGADIVEWTPLSGQTASLGIGGNPHSMHRALKCALHSMPCSDAFLRAPFSQEPLFEPLAGLPTDELVCVRMARLRRSSRGALPFSARDRAGRFLLFGAVLFFRGGREERRARFVDRPTSAVGSWSSKAG